jgi:hypothetical protein
MMKSAMIGALVAAGLVVFAAGGAPLEEARAQRVGPHGAAPTAELIALTSETGAGQQLTIIDPRTRVMAVYQVDAKASGDEIIRLKSVRRFDWDLQMEEFNAASPLPREVRSQVDQSNHQR